MSAPTELTRFLTAQNGVWDRALAELQAGEKRSHWMWFVLPQIAGLGTSEMSRRYAIADLAEAQAYLAHPVLGPRLRACVTAVLAHAGKTAHAIFGSPDDVKFRACLTLFAQAAPEDPLFPRALTAFYDGPDPKTEAMLREEGL
ncbi:MAG: DUF1810 domain-containing protein [Pseudomonadota bacterium]